MQTAKINTGVNSIAAPSFEELTHAATNIVLTAQNDGAIWSRLIEPLIATIARKASRGVSLDICRLAKSSAMGAVIRAAISWMGAAGWDGPVTSNDRAQSSLYLAECFIERATL